MNLRHYVVFRRHPSLTRSLRKAVNTRIAKMQFKKLFRDCIGLGGFAAEDQLELMSMEETLDIEDEITGDGDDYLG